MYQRCLKVKAVWLKDVFLFHEGQQVVWFNCWCRNIWSCRERAVKYSRRRFVKLYSSQGTNWRQTLHTSERLLRLLLMTWDLCTHVKWWFILRSRTRWRTWLWWSTDGSLCWFCWSADTCWHHRGKQSHRCSEAICWFVFQRDRRLGLNRYLPGSVTAVGSEQHLFLKNTDGLRLYVSELMFRFRWRQTRLETCRGLVTCNTTICSTSTVNLPCEGDITQVERSTCSGWCTPDVWCCRNDTAGFFSGSFAVLVVSLRRFRGERDKRVLVFVDVEHNLNQ